MPPTPVNVMDAYFYPDVEISEYSQRLLAVEVKFIRDGDPSGAISKAIGQTSIYAENGFRYAHAVLIECRESILRNRVQVEHHETGPRTSFFRVFATFSAGQLTAP